MLCTLDGQGTYPDPDTSGWVVNPTCATGEDCAWNDQDSVLRYSTGYVEGAWTDWTCLFADFDNNDFCPRCNYPKTVYVNVYAPNDSLVVRLSNDVGDAWVAGPSVAAGNYRKWRLCVEDPVADRINLNTGSDASLYWPPVPGSNGGYAQRVTYSLTLTTLGQRARDVTAMLEVAGSGPLSTAPRTIRDCS